MAKKLTHEFSDEHLFRQEMDDVMPLKTAPTTASKAPRALYRKLRQEIVPATFAQISSPSTDNQTHIDTNDDSSHRKNGIQNRVMQKLKKGHFPVGDQLDLHHMTMETAHKTLLEFITDAQCRTLECIRIIHGKGLHSKSGPRLKLMTQQVLREHPRVRAFTACKPADGGTGAMDVLLKST